MNNFLINEITKIQEDVQKGSSNSYNNTGTARQNLSTAMGRLDTIISLLKNKTIVVKYKGAD